MHIDWAALGTVAVVSIGSSLIFTILLASGIRLVSAAKIKSNQGGSSTAHDHLWVMRYAAQPRGQVLRPVSPATCLISNALLNQCSTSPGCSAMLPNGRIADAKRSHLLGCHSKHHSKNFAPGFANDLTRST